jgi:hypothetical protein
MVNEKAPAKYSEPFWKFLLPWAIGGFLGICLLRGFPPSREGLVSWLTFVAGGTVANGLVRVLDPRLRRIKAYRELEARLGLNRDAGA